MLSLMRRHGEMGNEPADHASDVHLVVAARSSAAAFDHLYERYATPVLNYCYYRLGNWPDAEDAAQQIFTNAFAGLTGFHDRPDDPEGSFRSWLFTIAHHEIVNRHRHRGRHPEASLSEAADISDAHDGPEEMAVSADLQSQALALLSQLTDEQNRVIELRMAGLTDTEIGALLGISAGAVRALQFRAVKRLRDLLDVRPAGGEGGHA